MDMRDPHNGGTSSPGEGRPKVLITGASGLIGRLTLAALRDKYEFSALNRRPVSLACKRILAMRRLYGMSVLCIRLGAVLDTDKPKLLRHFPGYLSQADAVQMIDKCLAAPMSLKYGLFDATSDNKCRWRSTGLAKDVLGWRPTGSADNFDPDDYR